MYRRLLHERIAGGKRSLFLFGPRQVGKSTLLSALHPDLTVNLASPATFRAYLAEPERLERELRSARPQIQTVFVDEVQHVPPLLDVVQVLHDEMPGRFRFLLSGSSARKLRRGQANLLPGRVHVHYLHPLLARELGSDFDLERVLAHGTLPGIYAETDPESRARALGGYADTYLREEVQAEALVRDLASYARLLDLIAASSGRILNLLALARDVGIRQETARRYVQVLEDTLVLFRIPAWSGSDRARLIAHPRLYLFDIGVRNALLRRPLDRCLPDERGLLLEHLVALELHRRTGTIWPELAVFHYRTHYGAEVDFLAEVGREIWGIEVKASRQVSQADLRGLETASTRVPRFKRSIVVFLGERKQQIRHVEVIPLEAFLESLPS